ncbi:MAG: alcohol dehydrogenase catalytic domain-containing protein [Alphaproteobacteria bacterium]|nr:alcohol dehydrogenase catalytic domain-containing protein [Alphaproteobacteria bacterium]
MRSYKIAEFGGSVSETIQEIPEPTGTEVLVKVTHAGVCHSDLHIADGYYDLGSGARMTLGDRGIKLPHTMGHEVLGTVVKAGPDAGEVPIGAARLLHPWIGCMECSECQRGRENHCAKPQSLGVFRDGGYAEYTIVPHPKFLVDVEGIDPAVATPYACSGVTVFSALKKALPVGDDEWLVIMGCGGLGLGAVSISKALNVKNVVACDINDAKLEAAMAGGASRTVNLSAGDALDQLRDLTGGGPRAVVDTVGAEATSSVGIASLVKGGRYVIVGLFGGELRVPLPSIPLRAVSILGSYTGNLAELKELIQLVKDGKVKSIPVATRPLAEVDQTLNDLRDGKIVGRVVLTN